MIKAEIVTDSLNPKGCRLTTFVLEYPRWIHAEVLTHRMFSKNAASSRAIPIEKFYEKITNEPAFPEFWGKNQKGMQAVEELTPENIEKAKQIWIETRDLVINQVKKLQELDVHKQIANRLMEPWFHIRVILSGTDFENFFKLRAHKDAQPEFQALAYKMLDCYNQSQPKQLKDGEWHIPFGDNIDINKARELIKEEADQYSSRYLLDTIYKKIAVARCARVSYLNFEGKDDYSADVKLCDRLFANIPKHLSPAEHVAMSLDSKGYCGNFQGFKQYRKFFTDENLKDERVTKNGLVG